MINLMLGTIQFASISIIAFLEYKARSLSLFLWGTLLIMFGFPHLFVILLGISGYDELVMIKASLFVILFNIVYLITRMILTKGFRSLVMKTCLANAALVHNKKSKDFITIRMNRYHFIVLCISLSILLYFVYRYLGGLSGASWGAFRRLNSKLGLKSLQRYGTFLFFGSAGVALSFAVNQKRNMFLMTMTMIVVYCLLTGNRITILPAMVTIVLIYLRSESTNLSAKKIAGLLIISFFAIYVIYMLRLLRFYGGFYNMFSTRSLVELNGQVLEMLLNGEGELGLRRAFYHFIKYDNNFANFNKGHTYIRLLLIGVPSFIIPDIKPPDFAISMGSAWSMNPYNTTYSMHPTLYGDCFANLSWFGVFLGIFWGLFVYFADKKIAQEVTSAREISMVLLGTVYVIIGRGSVYNGIFYGFAGVLVIICIKLLSRFRLRTK